VSAAASTGFTGVVIAVYSITTIFNAAVTNNAAVAIMFPITAAVAKNGGYPFEPLLLTLMFAGT
jgi:Na+/H+ antiporter NhaD/arsenite permease-like protein